MIANPKYTRIEWERRFLLDRFPSGANVVCTRRISDRYILGTRLRLRRLEGIGETVFKLTQKIPSDSDGAQQGLITSLYLSEDEFKLLAELPANVLTKTRCSVPPFGIDVFEGELQGLILAEAEFESENEAIALPPPPFAFHEVTEDRRFTGGQLVTASRSQLRSWLAEYGIRLQRTRTPAPLACE